MSENFTQVATVDPAAARCALNEVVGLVSGRIAETLADEYALRNIAHYKTLRLVSTFTTTPGTFSPRARAALMAPTFGCMDRYSGGS